MPRFIVVLKDGKRYAVEATGYCSKEAMLGLTAAAGDVAAFPWVNVEALYREDCGGPLEGPLPLPPLEAQPG